MSGKQIGDSFQDLTGLEKNMHKGKWENGKGNGERELGKGCRNYSKD